MTIGGIGNLRLAECRDGARGVPGTRANFTQHEPGGGEARRPLERLLQEIGGGGQIALLGQRPRAVVAPVGEQIAGGEKQRSKGHRRELVLRRFLYT
jgi:hypothetical protein